MPDDANTKMTIGPREIGMVAKAMVQMFGEDAPTKTMERASEYQEDGDARGHDFWITVTEAVNEELERRSNEG